jgi:hypothetical protein
LTKQGETAFHFVCLCFINLGEIAFFCLGDGSIDLEKNMAEILNEVE